MSQQPSGGPVEEKWATMMRAASAGDEGVYRRLLEEIGRSVRAMARGAFSRARMGDADVEDVVQETLLAIHLKRQTWDGGLRLAPWVNAIARHKIIDALRRRGVRRYEPIEDFEAVLAAPEAEDPHTRGDVERLLEQLPPRARDIVKSISLDGQSITATAMRLMMTEVAVRVALHRALKTLAAAWRGEPMKTSDLIAALAADKTARSGSIGRQLALALGVGALISAALFMSALGPRHDIAAAVHTMRFDMKFVDTLALLLPCALLCLRLSRPDAGPGAMAVWLAAPLVLLAGAVAMELMMVPSQLWETRLIGHNWMHCLMLIPLLSIPPLTGLILALREGAPRRPALTGALAGAAAAGVGATIYATNCTDDSPLFVASWYPLATLVVVAAGAVAGRRFLRW